MPVTVSVIPDTSPPAEKIVTFLGCKDAAVVKLIVLLECRAPLITRLAEPLVVCAAHTPSLSLATRLEFTAVQPMTVGVAVTAVDSSDVPPVIILPVANIAVGSFPKLITTLLAAVDTTVPVAATPEASAALTTPVTVSPTVRSVPSPLVTTTV